MEQIIIGVDPDAEKHGIAIYEDGKLAQIEMMTAPDLLDMGWRYEATIDKDRPVLFSIENVMKNQFVYARNRHGSKNAQSKIAMHIGRCQQAQVELMRWLDHYGIPYVLHNPQSGNWAKDKAQFERVTGWAGRSNEDTRAAAYFGYLAL